MSLAPSTKLRILVLGYVVRRPLGGGTWPTTQYALGFLGLGHDVYFVEDSSDYPACYDPRTHITGTDPSFGIEYATKVFGELGLGERWAYYDAHTDTWLGPCQDRFPALCDSVDVVVNVSGINTIRPWMAEIPKRLYLDTDPAFGQIREAEEDAHRAHLDHHNVFFTYGENIPAGTSQGIPIDSRDWIPTRQPVVLDRWPVTPPNPMASWTTVMLWSSYAKREFEGRSFGMKSDSFEGFWDLPSHTTQPLELAVGGPKVPRDELRDHGWSIVHALEVTPDPWVYQRYLASSKGEFTIAKQGYVISRCGWFSERSAHYLASGRPVVTQSTGFEEWLPTGEGLFAFREPGEAADALDQVASDLPRHSAAARALAEEHFDSRKVLTRLLEAAHR